MREEDVEEDILVDGKAGLEARNKVKNTLDMTTHRSMRHVQIHFGISKSGYIRITFKNSMLMS